MQIHVLVVLVGISVIAYIYISGVAKAQSTRDILLYSYSCVLRLVPVVCGSTSGPATLPQQDTVMTSSGKEAQCIELVNQMCRILIGNVYVKVVVVLSTATVGALVSDLKRPPACGETLPMKRKDVEGRGTVAEGVQTVLSLSVGLCVHA